MLKAIYLSIKKKLGPDIELRPNLNMLAAKLLERPENEVYS